MIRQLTHCLLCPMPQLSRMMSEHSRIWLKEYTVPPLMALMSSEMAFLPWSAGCRSTVVSGGLR